MLPPPSPVGIERTSESPSMKAMEPMGTRSSGPRPPGLTRYSACAGVAMPSAIRATPPAARAAQTRNRHPALKFSIDAPVWADEVHPRECFAMRMARRLGVRRCHRNPAIWHPHCAAWRRMALKRTRAAELPCVCRAAGPPLGRSDSQVLGPSNRDSDGLSQRANPSAAVFTQEVGGGADSGRAATRLGITERRGRQLLAGGRLVGCRVGKLWPIADE